MRGGSRKAPPKRGPPRETQRLVNLQCQETAFGIGVYLLLALDPLAALPMRAEGPLDLPNQRDRPDASCCLSHPRSEGCLPVCGNRTSFMPPLYFPQNVGQCPRVADCRWAPSLSLGPVPG